MNASLISLEIAVALLGLGFLLLDLWTPVEHKRKLGYLAAFAVLVVFACTFRIDAFEPKLAFNNGYVLDSLSLFFKRFFLLAAVLVLIMAAEFADRIEAGITEYYSLILFGLLIFQTIEVAGIACLVGAGDTRTGSRRATVCWIMESSPSSTRTWMPYFCRS